MRQLTREVKILKRVFFRGFLWLVVAGFPCLAMSAETIELTQTGCQFVQPEGIDHQFHTRSAEDCEAVNEQTGSVRLKESDVMRLRAGDYVFRVKNKNVPYELGFWLRGTGLQRLTLPSVSGGGISTGASRDYAISLEPGEYRYSCPLNPTPDYILIVE